MPNDQWGKNPKQLECGCLNYSYDKLYPLFFFRPRYCFRYLAIRMKYYFNIICQCFSVLPFPATTNNKPKAQPNRKCSWYSSKVKILGSQPDVISLIWIDHMFIVPIFNWDLAHILQPRLASPHIYISKYSSIVLSHWRIRWKTATPTARQTIAFISYDQCATGILGGYLELGFSVFLKI